MSLARVSAVDLENLRNITLYGVEEGFMEKWIKRLRAGRIDQAHGALRDDHDTHNRKNKMAMCCLGVACHVIDPKGWHMPEGSPEDSQPWWKDFPEDATTNLTWIDEDSARSLAELNDSDATFQEIADILSRAKVTYRKNPRKIKESDAFM